MQIIWRIFVLQGAGIAWLPKITIEEDLLKKKLKIINAREYIIKQQIFIFKNKIRKDDYLKSSGIHSEILSLTLTDSY